MATDTAAIDDLANPACEKRKGAFVVVSRETGTLWFVGWLFTIGFAGLGFWQGVLALILWPYFLGRLLVG
jgi:hypothetical protein